MFAKFGKDKVSQSMVEVVKQITEGEDCDCATKPEAKQIADKEAKKEVGKHEKEMHKEDTQIDEVAPPGFEGTVKAMKKHKDITNPFALAWSMKNKGYKSHRKPDGSVKEESEIEEELKGNQHKLDKNKNGKLDSDDFKKLRKEEEDYGTHNDKKEEDEDIKLIKKMVKKDALKTEETIDEGKMKDIATDRAESNRLNVPKKNTDVADKSYLKTAGKKSGPLHNVGKGLKAFLQGKPEPMESVEVDGEQLDEVSSSTLKSYINKAKPQMKSAQAERQSAKAAGDWRTATSAMKVQHKREAGIKIAKAKLNAEEVGLEEAVSRKDFQMVADLIKTHDSHDKRKELAQHHAEIFHRQNPRFDRAKFMKAANVNEETEQFDEASKSDKRTWNIAMNNRRKEQKSGGGYVKGGTKAMDDNKKTTQGRHPGGMGNRSADEWNTPAAVKAKDKFKAGYKVSTKQMSEAKRPEDDSVPFAPPYETTSKDVVTDKSGAQHTPMSRAKDLARSAMKRIKTEMLGKAPGNN